MGSVSLWTGVPSRQNAREFNRRARLGLEIRAPEAIDEDVPGR